MSQSASPLPRTVTLPAAFSLSFICTLLRALPAPDPLQPAAEADRLRKTLLLVQELAPRTVLEAMLVQQIVLGMVHGPWCAMQATLAAQAEKPAVMAQFERLVLAHGRLVGNLMRQRAVLRAAGGAEAAEPEQTWDLAELAAMWRGWHAAGRGARAGGGGSEHGRGCRSDAAGDQPGGRGAAATAGVDAAPVAAAAAGAGADAAQDGGAGRAAGKGSGLATGEETTLCTVRNRRRRCSGPAPSPGA